MTNLRNAVVLVVLGLAAASCGGDDAGDDTAGDDTTTAAADDGITPPEGESGPGNCEDAVGDGGSAAMDLQSVNLEIEEDLLVVTWQTAAATPPEERESALYALRIFDGDASFQLGARLVGDVPEVFVFDVDSAEHLDAGTMTIEEDLVTAEYPLSALPATTFDWFAESNLDGTYVDQCPDQPASEDESETLSFAGEE